MKRFWNKVNKTESCWLWNGATRGRGYGCLKVDGKVIDSHRQSYILTKGEIPEGLFVCHTCDNKLCVNPEHLFLGTRQDNIDDAQVKGLLARPHLRGLINHPSQAAYRNGCRCEGCKTIQKERARKYRQALKTKVTAIE